MAKIGGTLVPSVTPTASAEGLYRSGISPEWQLAQLFTKIFELAQHANM